MDSAGAAVLVVFILVIVAAAAYRVGYLWAQVEYLNRSLMIETKWRRRNSRQGKCCAG